MWDAADSKSAAFDGIRSFGTGDLKSRGPDAAPNPKSACKQRGFLLFLFSVLKHPSKTSLQLHIPSCEGIEYAAMVEQVDTADLKSAEE